MNTGMSMLIKKTVVRVVYMTILLIVPLQMSGKCGSGNRIVLCIEGHNCELSVSVNSTEHINGWDKSVLMELKKEGCKYMENRLPLTGNCPLEEQVEVSARNDGFGISLWFCSGYDYIRGNAEFVYSKRNGDFVLKSYREEITDRLNPEHEKEIIYPLHNVEPIVLSTFNPISIRQKK